MLKMPHDEKHRVTRRSNLVWHIVMSPQTTQPVAESIKGNHNYLKYNHCTLFAAHRKFLIRTTFLNCLSTSIRTTSKMYKNRWGEVSMETRRRIIETRSIISNSLISRSYIALFTLSTSTCPASASFRINIETQKTSKKSLLFYFIKFFFWRKIILRGEFESSVTFIKT